MIDALLFVIAVLAVRSIQRERREHDREVINERIRLYRGNL